MKTNVLAVFTVVFLTCTCLCSVGADKPVLIAVAGDSTVEDCPLDKPTRGWGQMIGAYFKDGVKTTNFARGGQSTKTYMTRGFWGLPASTSRWDLLLASKPDFILLQFGHNDSHEKGKPESTDAATDYKDYLRRYADDAKRAGAEIVFITPMHRRLFDKSGTPTEELLPYANAMKAVAREKGIPCIDLHASSGEFLKGLGEAGSEDLFVKADRSHFSEKGAKAMTGLIVQGLNKADAMVALRLK
jgi:lysophospholipase L1-like esterase